MTRRELLLFDELLLLFGGDRFRHTNRRHRGAADAAVRKTRVTKSRCNSMKILILNTNVYKVDFTRAFGNKASRWPKILS